METIEETSLTQTWLSRLQENGYRLTTPLRVIVEILVSGERALSPVEVYDLGRQAYPRLGLVTV
jgi:Fe2+ or Zn2+ uptake regulation protein